jgi:hypothetical protein
MRKAPAWPALTPEVVPIAQLAAYKNNPRTHSQTQIAQLARSLKTFGWTNAVLRDEHGTLIAGHGRIAAAKLLAERGEKDFLEAPVITAQGLVERSDPRLCHRRQSAGPAGGLGSWPADNGAEGAERRRLRHERPRIRRR